MRTKKENKKAKISVAIEKETHQKIQKIISICNKKKIGRPIVIADVVKYAIDLLTDEDHEKIKELSLTIRNKIELEYKRYIEETDSKETLDEFIAKKLEIQ